MPFKNKTDSQKYKQSWYQSKRDDVIKKVLTRRKVVENYIESVKLDGCSRCPEKHPATLDFHHLKDKKFTINAAKKSCSLDVVKAEIAKCILLCSNCHRKLHWDETRGS